MPVKKRRLNIDLDPALYDVLKLSAEKAGISLSLKARDLIKEALEIKEDLYWEKIAEKREKTFFSGRTTTSL